MGRVGQNDEKKIKKIGARVSTTARRPVVKSVSLFQTTLVVIIQRLLFPLTRGHKAPRVSPRKTRARRRSASSFPPVFPRASTSFASARMPERVKSG